MCRFLAYIGSPIVMDDLLYKPKNSLIHQSYKAQEREEPLNGDGFGIGWYQQDIDPLPAVFVSVRPAWNNRNLRHLAPKIRSDCIFAHVRAASSGGVTAVNCHPFNYGNLMFMHNGEIGGFARIKRALRHRLSDEIYASLTGETDSEHFFALFLNNLQRQTIEPDCQDVVSALETTIAEVQEISFEQGVDEPSLLNIALTNGKFLVASRYVSSPEVEANTLYHSSGSRYECLDGVCHMVKTDPSEHAVLVVSEKLTDFQEDWHEVPVNHIISVDETLRVATKAISC